MWQDVEYKIKMIMKASKEPGVMVFRVVTDNDKSFELFYDESEDEWVAVELSQEADKNEN